MSVIIPFSGTTGSGGTLKTMAGTLTLSRTGQFVTAVLAVTKSGAAGGLYNNGPTVLPVEYRPSTPLIVNSEPYMELGDSSSGALSVYANFSGGYTVGWVTADTTYVPPTPAPAPPEYIEPVDVEQAVIDELASHGYIIGTGFPSPLPETFLRVVAIGGVERDLVTDSATLVLETFSLRETNARAAANRSLAILQDAVRRLGKLGNETAYMLEVAALPQNFPLPSVPSHVRYTTTISPAIRRRVTTI